MAFNLEGKVQSGGTSRDIEELEDAQVRLFETTSGIPLQRGAARTNRNGRFEIESPIERTNGVFYVTARTAQGVDLMTLIGPELPDEIVVNELTTVAAVWSASRFMSGTNLGGDAFGLQIAAKMNANVVSIRDGESSEVMLRSPNADQTDQLRVTRALANLLASCVRHPESCPILYQLATPPGGTPPTNTLAAMHNIARHPANHAIDIYHRSRSETVYEPPLETPPDAWTIAVKVNDSGSTEHLFAGPGLVVFDDKGRGWIANNVVQGTPHSTEWSIVLDCDGRPAVDSSGRRMSPFKGGGMIGPGFGIAVGPDKTIWVGNFGWGGEAWYPHPSGSMSRFTPDARPISPEGTGYQEGVFRVQATVFDKSGNLWMASYGNKSVVVYPGGDPTSPVSYTGAAGFMPFGIAIAADGTAWVTSTDPALGSVTQLSLQNGSLTKVREVHCGHALKGIVIDSSDNIWVASGGNATVYLLDIDGVQTGAFQSVGGLDGPWGLCLDGDDNVWAGNFGPLRPGSDFHGRVTQLAGPKSGQPLGTALTPHNGYRVHTAGEQVLMGNGEPLYGPNGPECHIPMMRTTGLNVDQAGNLWTCNNWKPNFDIDHTDGNPGGDGMLIFLGVAAPRKWS